MWELELTGFLQEGNQMISLNEFPLADELVNHFWDLRLIAFSGKSHVKLQKQDVWYVSTGHLGPACRPWYKTKVNRHGEMFVRSVLTLVPQDLSSLAPNPQQPWASARRHGFLVAASVSSGMQVLNFCPLVSTSFPLVLESVHQWSYTSRPTHWIDCLPRRFKDIITSSVSYYGIKK